MSGLDGAEHDGIPDARQRAPLEAVLSEDAGQSGAPP